MRSNKEQFAESLLSYLDTRYGACDENIECQSPIEAMFYQAFSICADLRGVLVSTDAQHKIADYRVDFFITALGRCVDCTAYRYSKSIVVECDGHAFHERTKDQASRDKERDRTLQALGYNIFRFTGSDIWRDVFSCADEVLEILSADLEGNQIAHWHDIHGPSAPPPGCLHCNKQFSGHKKYRYCSHDCYDKAQIQNQSLAQEVVF